MREVYIKSKAGTLPIGSKGENLATRVIYPGVPEEGQAVTVFVKRNGDSVAYPASQVEVTDTEVIWTVTSVDTNKQGRGQVQYRFSDSVTGEVIKTDVYGFLVGLAIDTEVGPAPDPYETWLDSLTELAGQAQVAARDAEANATQAAESAESASESAQHAEQSASSAGTYATNAQTSATTATQKAAQAAASEANAQTYAGQAQESAESAGASATSAEGSAESASASADSASESKTAAGAASQSAHEWGLFSQTYASQAAASATAAGQSEQAASASATSASQSATTATAKASEASASATTATTKATEASASATAAQAAQTGAETARAGAESAAQTAQAGADTVGLLREQIYNSYPNVEAEAGSIVSISDGADGIPVKSLVVGIEPVQAGSGDPSPDNVRPITGWTGANVYRTGVNIWDEEYDVISNARIASKNLIPVRPNTEYAWVAPKQPANGLRFYDASKTLLSAVYSVTNGKFTTPSNCYYIWFALAGAYGATYNHDISINYPASDNSYHAHTGQTIPIAFPSEAGTVYGGQLDVTNGVLTVDRAMVDLGTLTWASATISATAGNRFYSRGSLNLKAPESVSSLQGLVCSEYAEKIPSAYNQAVQGITIYTNMTVQIYDSSRASMTAEEFKTAMSGVQLVYLIATPITYQLTPTEVKTLLGSNAIWADTGDTSLAYRADTKLYIDEVYEEYQDDLADYADALAALG